MNKDELNLAIAEYSNIPQTGCGDKKSTTLRELLNDSDVKVISQDDCEQHGLGFPDDKYKVKYCGFFKSSQVPFWLYKQYPTTKDEEILISLG